MDWTKDYETITGLKWSRGFKEILHMWRLAHPKKRKT